MDDSILLQAAWAGDTMPVFKHVNRCISIIFLEVTKCTAFLHGVRINALFPV
jgi:hypothetical protein